jgi:hypothetical protein
VLKRLIELDIDPSLRDSQSHSALFYAARNGHKEAAELLIQAGAKSDDSSLHEAARAAHPTIVETLLTAGHRANFPSVLHADGRFGRTALEELCLNAVPGKEEDWAKKLHQTIALLLPTDGTTVGKTDQKTMLHLSLDSEHSVSILRILLEFPAVWENINHPVHLYKDEQGYIYSLTKYLQHFCHNKDPDTQQTLLTLLRAKKCEDCFYAPTVTQPEGACGLPEEIAAAVSKQVRLDHEHNEELKRLNAIAAHQRFIEDEDNRRSLAMAQEKHTLAMKQVAEQENAERQVAREKQSLALTHASELRREREAALYEENAIKLRGVSDEGARRKTLQDAEHASEFSHRLNLNRQEFEATQSRIAAERSLLDARDMAGRKELARRMEYLDRKDASVRFEAQQLRNGGNY